MYVDGRFESESRPIVHRLSVLTTSIDQDLVD